MQPSVLTRGDVAHAEIRLDDLNTIRARVNPTRVRISSNHSAGGSDISSAVQFVMDRNGKLENIDRAAFQHVLKKRAGLHFHRWDVLDVLHALAVALQIFHRATD